MTIKEVKESFELESIDRIPILLDIFKNDPRQGVRQICKRYLRKHEMYLNNLARVETLREFDQVFANNGQHLIAGIDEAGRGPLAGPVVAAAVILPHDLLIEGIDDSKKLSEKQRDVLYHKIMDQAISVGVGVVDSQTIDEINILQATFRAMKKALFSLDQGPEIVLVDGNQTIPRINEKLTQHAVIQGDSKSISIAAASIIAKVTRDRMMVDYNFEYPQYAFDQNKGYGSPAHQQVLGMIGPCPIHRMSFLKKMFKD